MKFKVCIFLLLLMVSSAWSITADQIIKRVDKNMTYVSGRFESTMLIRVRGQVRKKKIISYAQGRDKSFSEFTYPARDKGVKYLKIKDNMWMYLPSVEKIIKISGHMLRQSMMGSDFSYEDALESNKLLEKYSIKYVRDDLITQAITKNNKTVTEKRSCYVVDLVAKVKDVTYYKRRIWVDKKTYVPVREELFAKSGKKLKVMILGDVRKNGQRYYPFYIMMKNLLRKDSKTEMFTTKANFGKKIPTYIFTQRNLKK